MKIEMDMSYEKIEEVSIDAEYGDEILSAGWNPAVDLVCREQLHAVRNEQVAMPADLTTEIIDMFLRQMYSMQR
jgi:hypothetical protein